jgi:hypothetical protein
MLERQSQPTLKALRIGYLFILSSFAAQGFAAVITNADVIKLVQAGMDDGVVIEFIGRNDAKFSLEMDDLLQLKKSGASGAVISRMLKSTNQPPIAGVSTSSAKSREMRCEDISSGSIALRTATSEKQVGFKKARKESESSGAFRAFASILTVGIVSLRKVTDYAVLSGAKADVRTTDTYLAFDGLVVDRGLDPKDAIQLVEFSDGSVNTSSGRVLPIGEGTLSYWGSTAGTISHAPQPERIQPLNFEKVREDCVVNGRPVTVWTGKNWNRLKPGEYALLLEPDRYHDFGIDVDSPTLKPRNAAGESQPSSAPAPAASTPAALVQLEPKDAQASTK